MFSFLLNQNPHCSGHAPELEIIVFIALVTDVYIGQLFVSYQLLCNLLR